MLIFVLFFSLRGEFADKVEKVKGKKKCFKRLINPEQRLERIIGVQQMCGSRWKGINTEEKFM